MKSFKSANDLDPNNVFLKLHWAELEIHNNKFGNAISLLQSAELYCRNVDEENSKSSAKSNELLAKTGNSMYSQRNLVEDRRNKADSQLLSNIYSLQGLAYFRQSPNDPRVSTLFCKT